MIPNQPKKKKKVKVMVRKSKSDAKPAALKERSQIQVIAKAAQNNAKAGDKSVGQFTRAAIKGGLSRGDVKFKGRLGFKSADPSKMGGTVLKKDFVEKVPLKKRDGSVEQVKMVTKKGDLHPLKPSDAQVASTTRANRSSVTSHVIRTVDKANEGVLVRGSNRKETLAENFKTGSGKKPKDPRRRKIKVL